MFIDINSLFDNYGTSGLVDAIMHKFQPREDVEPLFYFLVRAEVAKHAIEKIRAGGLKNITPIYKDIVASALARILNMISERLQVAPENLNTSLLDAVEALQLFLPYLNCLPGADNFNELVESVNNVLKELKKKKHLLDHELLNNFNIFQMKFNSIGNGLSADSSSILLFASTAKLIKFSGHGNALRTNLYNGATKTAILASLIKLYLFILMYPERVLSDERASMAAIFEALDWYTESVLKLTPPQPH